MERIGQAFAHQQGLAGVFQDHRVARDKGWHQGVDGCEIRIVPRGHDKYHAKRFSREIAAELIAVFDDDGGQGLLGNLGHVIGARIHPAKLTAKAGGAAHLPRQLFYDAVFHRVQIGNPLAHQSDALTQGARGPALLRHLGPSGHAAGGIGRKGRAFGIDRTVNGRDQFDGSHQITS